MQVSFKLDESCSLFQTVVVGPGWSMINISQVNMEKNWFYMYVYHMSHIRRALG